MDVSASEQYTSVAQGQPPARVQNPWKKRIDTLINASILLTLLLAISSAFLPIFEGGLYVVQPKQGFGHVLAGKTLQHRFVLHNVHPWPVTIQDAKGSCGCTNVFPGRKVPFQLFPLQSTEIAVTVDTAGKAGKIEQPITVTTNDWSKHSEETVLVLEDHVD